MAKTRTFRKKTNSRNHKKRRTHKKRRHGTLKNRGLKGGSFSPTRLANELSLLRAQPGITEVKNDVDGVISLKYKDMTIIVNIKESPVKPFKVFIDGRPYKLILDVASDAFSLDVPKYEIGGYGDTYNEEFCKMNPGSRIADVLKDYVLPALDEVEHAMLAEEAGFNV